MFLKICAIGFSAFLAYDLVRFPLVPRLAYDLGAGPEMIGVIVAASTITGIVGKWLTGGLSDSWGRRRLLLIGCGVSAVMPLVYLLVRDYRALILVRALHGVTTAILAPVTRAVVSDLAPPNQRGAQLGTFSSAVQMGMSCGRGLGGVLLFWGGFRFPLLAATLAGCVAVWLVWTWPETAPRSPQASWRESVRTTFIEARAMLRSRVLVTISLVEASQFLVRGAIETFLPIYAIEVAALNDSHVGLLLGLQMFTLVLAKPLTGLWSDRVGRVPLISIGLLMSSALVWLIPRTTHLGVLSALVIAYSIGAALVTTSNLAWVTDLAETSEGHAGTTRYGASHGLFGTLVDMGHAAGPLAGGWLIARLEYTGTFLVLSIGLLVIGGALLWSCRRSIAP